MKKKFKVTFLFDKSNLWFQTQLKKFDFRLNHKYIFKFSKNPRNVKNQNIVFPISYTKILPESFLNNNELVLIIHASKLPKHRGFSPLQNQILKNKNKIYISLIKAVNKVDEGPIFIQNSFKLNGTELYDEIRSIQGLQFLKIIKKFLNDYPKVKSRKQVGKGNFNKKRSVKDSKLDIKKSIKQQFNHLRINDNKNYPSFFLYKGRKYIIKIYKQKI